ncbi:MAG: hypothetical protein FWG10_07900 [Eubacteriaceae bacterium]|nr:hypothetical protein [Eubacteriaceae bacterium]
MKTKKLAIALITAALLASLSACSQNKTIPNPGGTNETAVSSLIDWIINRQFSYDFEMRSVFEDQEIVGAGSMAMDGENFAITMETEIDGQSLKARIVSVDGQAFIIEDVNRILIKLGSIPAEMTNGIVIEVGEIQKIGEGTSEIEGYNDFVGKEFEYEDYQTEDGVVMRFFLEDGQVVAIASENEGFKVTMSISNTSDTAPDGIFDLPEGYTEMTMGE